jgi:hypothetical protein
MGTIISPFSPALAPAFLRMLLQAGPGPWPGRLYRADVVFGSPRADCSGTGVCKIIAREQEGEIAGRNCRRAPAVFSSGEAPGQLSMLLLREFLCVEVWKTQLRRGSLHLSEPCPVPAFLREFFHLPAVFLAPGYYAVQPRPDYLQIDFSWKMNH